MPKADQQLMRKLIIALSAGAVIGILWFISLRVILLNPQHTHYHANFALYVNGQRDEFKNFSFYEEIQSCSSDTNKPGNRVHMHDQVNDVVHVHDNGATWGHFFANLGYGLSNKSLTTDEGVFIDSTNDPKLTYILNGQEVNSIDNRVIGDEDKLLINYGSEAKEQLNERYSAIQNKAKDVNGKTDPASCAGTKPDNAWERVKRAVWQ